MSLFPFYIWADPLPCLAAHVTSPDKAPGLQQQHHVGLLQVLNPVGAEQPGGVAQHSQDASVQQVVGHVCIHSGQRVIEEIELLFLGRGGDTTGTKSHVRWSEPRPLLEHHLEAEKIAERDSRGDP